MEYLIVVFSASIDAYIAGFAYSLKRKLTFWQVLYAGSYTFFVSLAMLILGAYLKGITLISFTGALIFIAIGCKNYFGAFKQEEILKRNTAFGPTLLGIGVSIDAGVACLAVAVDGAKVLLCAMEMFLGHFLFLLLGCMSVRAIRVMKGASIASGVLMILLGIIKLYELMG